MYICNNCGEIFEETKQVTEYMGEFWGFPAYETYDCCPWCSDYDIDYYREEEQEEDEEEEE